MKKYIVPVLVLTVFLSFMLTGCKEKLKQSYGTVCDIQRSGDTLLNMRMVTGEGDTLVLNLDRAKFNRGIAMPGDSVLVNHLSGRGDTLRAIIVTVMAKPTRYFRPDTTSTVPLSVSDDSVSKGFEY